jgi:hypothetical protein
MIGSAYQQGNHIRVISPQGNTLYTQQGTLLGYTSGFVSILNKDHIRICDHQGNTVSTHPYKDTLQDNHSKIIWSKKRITLYLLFGWLVKIGDAYRLYQFLGRGNAIGNDGGDLDWKGIGIWMISSLFWIVCFTVAKAGYSIFN